MQATPGRKQRPLTMRQCEILSFLEQQPVPPSYRQIGVRFGIRSPNGVRAHLMALQAKGHIRINPDSRSAIECLTTRWVNGRMPLLGTIGESGAIAWL